MNYSDNLPLLDFIFGCKITFSVTKIGKKKGLNLNNSSSSSFIHWLIQALAASFHSPESNSDGGWVWNGPRACITFPLETKTGGWGALLLLWFLSELYWERIYQFHLLKKWVLVQRMKTCTRSTKVTLPVGRWLVIWRLSFTQIAPFFWWDSLSPLCFISLFPSSTIPSL